jgi:hypothetical protein
VIAARQPAGPSEVWWRTLLRLLAVPLFLSAVILGAWLAGGSRHEARIANAHLVMTLFGPLASVAAALSILKTGRDRALALPPPLMLWLIFSADRAATAPWYASLVAHAAAWVLLYACWQQKRRVAQVATICCGAAIVWIQLSGPLLHG